MLVSKKEARDYLLANAKSLTTVDVMDIKQKVVKILSEFIREDIALENDVVKLLRLPVVMVYTDEEKEDNVFKEYVINEKKKNGALILATNFILLDAIYYLGNSVVRIKVLPETFELPIDSFGDVHLLIEVYSSGSEKTKAIFFSSRVTVPQVKDPTVTYSDVTMGVPRSSKDKKLLAQAQKNFRENKTLSTAIMDMIGEVMVVVNLFGQYQDGLDKYPVLVTPIDQSKSKTISKNAEKRLLVKCGKSARLIYLNALPNDKPYTESAGDSTSTTPRKAHHRIGYWKTLTHPRYSKHPKYLEEKAIRVKPSFVGDVESEWKGNHYRILFKPE